MAKQRLECQAVEESGRITDFKRRVKIEARGGSIIPRDNQDHQETYRLTWANVQPPKIEIRFG